MRIGTASSISIPVFIMRVLVIGGIVDACLFIHQICGSCQLVLSRRKPDVLHECFLQLNYFTPYSHSYFPPSSPSPQDPINSKTFGGCGSNRDRRTKLGG